MYSIYINLDNRHRKVRIHRADCGHVRKNGVENDKHIWIDAETIAEAAAIAEQKAAEHDLSPWTDGECSCAIKSEWDGLVAVPLAP